MVSTALDRKKQLQNAHGHRQSHFAFSIGLFPKAMGQMLSGIKTAFLSSLKKEYPPSGYDVYETDETCQVWKEYGDATLYLERGKNLETIPQTGSRSPPVHYQAGWIHYHSGF